MKSVLWASCQRLSCSNSETPDVVICLTGTGIVKSPNCPDATPEPFELTTIDATLTKSWKDSTCGCNPGYRYLLQYNENDLVDPTTPLTTAQISGVFCKGCLTDWVEEEIGNEVSLVDNGNGTVTLTTQHGCEETVSYSIQPVTAFDASIVIESPHAVRVQISDIEDNNLALKSDGLYVSPDWISIDDTWTFINSAEVTVPLDATTIFRFGDRIRFKQGGGFKYFYIVVVTPTILQLYGGDDYSIANAPITNISFSRIDDPFGFPAGFNYTPSVSSSAGVVSGLVVNVAFVRLTGNTYEIWLNLDFNLTIATATSISVGAFRSAFNQYGMMNAQDVTPYNGTGLILAPATGTVLQFFKADGTTHWAVGAIFFGGYFKGIFA